MSFSDGLISICGIICVGLSIKSYLNAQKNIADNGAQIVVTVGVLLTFVGIAIGLYNFDTNAANMVNSINDFLEGMKLAFWTSIIGMIFGLIIKFLQRKVTPPEDVISETLKEILSAIKANENSELQRELRGLTEAMETFVPSMKNFSDATNTQSKMLERLSTTLTQSIDNLSQAQIKRLDAMRNSIGQMQVSAAQSEKNSSELLDETKTYQQQALDNDAAQLKILSDNTAQIVAMKNSFDNFMQDVAKNFSENFIAALNESIKNLNAQLQTQFGDNFKELNAAVREVVTWQDNYKAVVEATTAELKIINETFNREIMGELKTSLKTFADTSAQNVSVQNNLADMTARLAKVITQANESIRQMQTVTESFDKFSKDALDKNLALLKNHLDNLSRLEENFSAEIKKINGTAHNVALDTTQYLKDFNDTAESSMHVIRDTIARYKTDLNEETKSSLSNLHQLFETVAKNTDEQSDKAIKTLAGALAKVSEQMIDNYKTLVAKIKEVDELLIERRHLG